jgi:transposase
MKKTEFFGEILGLTRPWSVEDVRFSSESKEVEIRVGHRAKVRFPCPECGTRLSVHDHGPVRAWRSMDTGSHVTWVLARVPRVHCPFDGKRQVRVPWSSSHSRFTLAFERRAIDVLRETSVTGGTRLLRISWDEAWHFMERAVARGRLAKKKTIVPYLGVDEKAIAKGHAYFTIVSDLRRGTVEYVTQGRKRESLDEYYGSLTAEQLQGIVAVAMDMWGAYVDSTVQHVPEASGKIVFDRFHVMKHMNAALDAVRKREHRFLSAQGNETLKKTKYLWLYAEENRPAHYRQWFAQLKRQNLDTGRAFAIKECLRELWEYRSLGWAQRHWKHWHHWATHSRLPEVVAVAKTLRAHLPNVLTYFAHRITNATSEGVNSKIQGIKKTPTGIAIAITSRPRSISTAAASTSTPKRMMADKHKSYSIR